MKRKVTCLIAISLLAAACNAFAQEDDDSNDDPTGNVNLGMPMAATLNPTARFSNFGMGVTVGGGYNFTRQHALVGEFMWNDLFIDSGALQPIREAVQNPNVNGRSHLFAVTGNYRYERRGTALGIYFIGGGGLYYRTASLSQRVTIGTSTTCTRTYEWWGFSCSSGLVNVDQPIRGSSSSVLGANGGVGFTVRVSDAPYRVYVETRYHYAPTKQVSTQLVVVTLGIRY
jgi:hypothetical protein